MSETTKLLEVTSPFCTGRGVDFGCGIDPHPLASVLVDGQSITYDKFSGSREVHIRNIDGLFQDWETGVFDFTYSSHLVEHLRYPYHFLQECARLTKFGGNIVIVAPHEDWYWPNGHPDANPDHKWWHLNPKKIVRWLLSISSTYPMEIEHISEHDRSEDNWSFIVVAKRVEVRIPTFDKFRLTPEYHCCVAKSDEEVQ